MSARRAALARLLAVAGLVAMTPGPATAAPVPQPAVRRFDNGLTVAVYTDDRQPIVQLQVLVPAGAVHEAVGEEGLANLTFQMLGEGTSSRTGEAFNQAIQALGGALGGNASREFTTVHGSFLSADFEAGLELVSDVVLHPIFPEPRLMAVKSQLATGLVRARQNPATLADEHLWAAVYAGHPYGRSVNGALGSVSGLGVGQIRSFHRDRYRPDGALLAIAGDVAPERAFRVAEELFGSWGGRAREAAPAAPPAPATGWRVRIVDAPGLLRAELRMGTPGPARGAGDFEALTVAGELLRVDLAGGRVGLSGLRDGGLLALAGSVPVDSVGATVTRWRAVVGRWAAATPSDPVLEPARRRLTGSFTLQFETLGGWIAQWMAMRTHGLADDALTGYVSRIRALPGSAVHAAAARWAAPDRMMLVVVGPAARLRPQLEGIGTIEVVSAEPTAELAPTPSTTTTPPAPEQMIRGRSLAGRAAAAHGGLERLRGIRDSSLEGDMVMTPGLNQYAGRITQLRKEPDRFLFRTAFAALTTTQCLDGKRAWAQLGEPAQQIEDLDSLTVVALRAAFRSDLQHLLLAANDPTARVAWRGQERRDDRDVDVLEVVGADGERRLLFLDVTSHQLVAMEQSEQGHSARRVYRDLRPVDGVLWPFSEERLLDGQRAMTLSLSKVALNKGIPDATFRKPGTAAPPAAPSRPRPR